MPIAVECQGCQTKLKAPDKAAGKRLKCPHCQTLIAVPALDFDDLEPVAAPSAPATMQANHSPNRADDTPAPTARTGARAEAARSGPPPGDRGLDLMADHEVPEEFQEAFESYLNDDEHLIWFDRPRIDILLQRAKKFQLTGMLAGFLVATLLPTVAVVLLITQGAKTHLLILAAICGFFAVIFAAVGIWAAGAPGRVRRTATERACFALTNSRLLIHLGKGQTMFSRTGTSAMHPGIGRKGKGAGSNKAIASYTGMDLTCIQRLELKRFPGAGELCFGRSLVDEPAGGALFAVNDLRKVEKLVRETLVDPVIDKLLRGESLTAEEKEKEKEETADEKEEDKALPPDTNIKDFVAGRATPKDSEDPNIKAAPAGEETKLGKVPADLREEVEEELTAGEKILWAGRPERGPQGRGILGAITGAAVRKEPEYTLFALTNRRALLFAKKGTRVANRSSWSGDDRGPLSYYPPALRAAGLEDDKRIPSGGSIIFKKVQVKIVTTTQVNNTRGTRGHHSHGGSHTRTKVTYEMHYFGILHVRNYRAVARLLYSTLLAPLRGV